MNPPRLINVYRSPRESGLYIYLDREASISSLPSELLKHFGEPELALALKMTSERKLARVKAADVLKGIEEKGYYLQMPPLHSSASNNENF